MRPLKTNYIRMKYLLAKLTFILICSIIFCNCSKNKGDLAQNTATHVSMTLNSAVTYQKVTGFGGMIDPPSWVGTSNQLTLAETEKMYSQAGLGYNIIRMMVYPDQANWDTCLLYTSDA